MFGTAMDMIRQALETSGEALYWVTIGPIIELIKMISG